MIWLLVLALVFALLVAIFALQNAAVIVVHFFAWQVEVSLVLVVLASATVGALSVGLAAMVQRVRSGIRLRQLEARVRELEGAQRPQLAPQMETAPADEPGGGPGGQVPPPRPPRVGAPEGAEEDRPAGGPRR